MLDGQLMTNISNSILAAGWETYATTLGIMPKWKLIYGAHCLIFDITRIYLGWLHSKDHACLKVSKIYEINSWFSNSNKFWIYIFNPFDR